MKKIFIAVFLICLIPVLLSAQAQNQPNPSKPLELKLANTIPGAKLYKLGKINVIELHGSFLEMGRQYGQLMKQELDDFYKIAVEEKLIKSNSLTFEQAKTIAESIYRFYPKRFKEILIGMSEASGLPLEKILILDQLEGIAKLGNAGVLCSGIAAWSEYTANGPLVFGRNFDYPEYFKDFAPFMAVTVFNPTDSSNSVAIYGYIGHVSTFTGMNEAGVFLEMNNGADSGGKILYNNRISAFVQQLSYLFDFSNLSELDAAINTSRNNWPVILNVADAASAYSYECPTFAVLKRNADKPGLLVATNHFVSPQWGFELADPNIQDMTLKRRANLLALGEKYKGKIDSKVMMEILDTKIEEGGATMSFTIYQAVALPGELKLWIKAVGYQDWALVDLKPVFVKK